MYLQTSTREMYLEFIKKHLSQKRLSHTLGAEKCAISLAKHYKVNVISAQTAALFHDVAKRSDDNTQLETARTHGYTPDAIHLYRPDLLHGINAAFIAQDMFDIHDEDILNAIRYHTTGRANMSMLEKIIYMSDLIEETRDYEGVDVFRKLVYKDMDRAMVDGMIYVMEYLLKKRVPVHPTGIEAINYYLLKQKEEDKCKDSANTR